MSGTDVVEPAQGVPALGPDAPPLAERALRSDVLLMLSAKLCMLVLGAATTVIVARALGPAGRGTLASVFALVALLAQLGTFGIVSANPYFVAREPQLLGRIAGNSVWLAGILGVVMGSIGVAVKVALPGSIADVSWPELAAGMLAVPVALNVLFLQSILLAEGRMGLYNGIEVATALLAVVLLLTIPPLVGSSSVLLLLALMIGSQVVALAVYACTMRRHGPLLRRPDRALARRMLGYGARAYLVTLLAYLLIRIDLLLVNGIQGARQAGQYSIAVALAEALYTLPVAVSVNLFARIARGSADREVTLRVFHLIAAGYLLVCAAMVPLAGPLVTLLFGRDYYPAVSLFWWLLPGVYCLGVLNVIAYHFAARGMPRELALVWLPGLALNLTLDVTLLPDHGTYVASLASSVAYALVLILHLRMFAREMGSWSALRPTVTGTASTLRLALRRDGAARKARTHAS